MGYSWMCLRLLRVVPEKHFGGAYENCQGFGEASLVACKVLSELLGSFTEIQFRTPKIRFPPRLFGHNSAPGGPTWTKLEDSSQKFLYLNAEVPEEISRRKIQKNLET